MPRPDCADLVVVLLHHSRALEYDWRARFGFGLRELVTDRLTVREAVALTAGLLRDPTSHTHAAAFGWIRPMSETAQLLAQLLDHYTQVHFENPQPWSRPWTTAPAERDPVVTARVLARLKARGPQPAGG